MAVNFLRSDLEFILQQILYGSFNNPMPGQENFGAADQPFPSLLEPDFRLAGPVAFDIDGPGGQNVGDPTSYAQTTGNVFAAQPRAISNLILDQPITNPTAVQAFIDGGFGILVGGVLHHLNDDGTPGAIVEPGETLTIPNKAQALGKLGIVLTDADVGRVPLVLTDAYGNFIAGENGFPQLITATSATMVLVQGSPTSPVAASSALETGHAFIIDIAHAANPAKIADDDAAIASPFITLTNSSFEADPMTADGAGPVQADPLGNDIIGNPQDWVITGTGGVYDPADRIVDPGGVTGSNVVWLNPGASLSQDTTVDLQEGRTYRLTFNVADRTDQGFGSVSLTTRAIAAAQAGEQLRIEIVNTGAGGGQILVDNVQLNLADPYDNELLDAHLMAGGRVNENFALSAVHHVLPASLVRAIVSLPPMLLPTALSAAHAEHPTGEDFAIQAMLVLFMGALLVNVIVSAVVILRERHVIDPEGGASPLASEQEQRPAPAAPQAKAPATLQSPSEGAQGRRFSERLN
jgi:hypothetical protein